jgi:hypothetical protein
MDSTPAASTICLLVFLRLLLHWRVPSGTKIGIAGIIGDNGGDCHSHNQDSYSFAVSNPESRLRVKGMFSLMSFRCLNTVIEFMQLRFLATLLTSALTTGLTGCKEGVQSQPASRPAPIIDARASVPVAAQTANGCLSCHGPFDKLIQTTANYVAPSGEKTSPHRYVPHDSKLEKDIPECSRCHTAHPVSPLPAKGSIDLSKVNVEWCFTCHHEKNLKSCKDCHP